MALAITSVAGSMTFATALQEALGIAQQRQNQNVSQPLAMTLTGGSGADQCNKYTVLTGSVVAASPVSYDFQSAVIDLATGAAASWSLIRAYIFLNLSTAGNLLIGGGSNPIAFWTNATTIYPSTTPNPGVQFQSIPIAAGIPIVAATGDILKVDASAGTVDYKLWIWGA